MTPEEKEAKKAEREAKKAAALAEKEAAKAAKEKEKEALAIVMSATTFFQTIYAHLSLALTTSVDKVHFQPIQPNPMEEKQIAVFYENKAFPFCRCYVKFKESFFENNAFAKWILMENTSFSLPIEIIDLLRKMKTKPGKAETIVPVKLDYDSNRLLLRYTKFRGSDEVESASIRLVKGTTDYWERIRSYVEKPFLRIENITDWLFDKAIANIYLDGNRLVSNETDIKILEIASKDIYVELKDDDAIYASYTTEADERSCRWVCLTGATQDKSLVVGQVMKVISKKKD